MIGPDGHVHRWTALRKIIQRVLKINTSTKCLCERLCDFKIYAVSVLSCIGFICARDKATLKAEAHALQRTTAGPYTAIPSNFVGVGSVCGSALRPAIELLHARPRSAKALTKSNWLVGTNALLFSLFLVWEKQFLAPSTACSTANAFDIVVWTVMANLMKFRNKRRRLLLDYFQTNYMNKTLLASFPSSL